ncbi:MAG: DegT/DnrJ/EryC1/StrS family aminotransferase [Elusimicrobia bacterium]|nr:DegT/DnrJ/EryC1/StrS family aminotransferase [Elusimicrobiota bacterium]
MRKTKIPLCDLKKQYSRIRHEVDAAVKKVFKDSDFIMGKDVSLLENKVAEFFRVKYAAGVASGTDALVLALIAAGVSPGDEVITTPFTFAATVEAIVRAGGIPIFADIEDDTYNISPDEIEKKITRKTKAILPVHLYGHPAEMSEIRRIARGKKLKIVEDCAQAFGAEYKGRNVGTFGDVGCLSFFPAKNLGASGDGGMIITNSAGVNEKVSILRNHGFRKKNFQIMRGFNSRLDTVHAAVLLVKMKYIRKWIDMRIKNAAYYSKLLSHLPEIEVPKVRRGAKHSFNYYTIRIRKGRKNRDFLEKFLNKKGIACGVYYPRCQHLQKSLAELGYRKGDFPKSEKASAEILTLPIYPEMTGKQIEFVVGEIKKGLKRAD